MSLLRKSWADTNSKADISIDLKHALIRPYDVSFSCQIENTGYNYDLENSHSGLNFLLNKAKINSDSLCPDEVPVPDDTHIDDLSATSPLINAPSKNLPGQPDMSISRKLSLRKLRFNDNEMHDLSNTRTKRGHESVNDEDQPTQLSELLAPQKVKSQPDAKKRKQYKPLETTPGIKTNSILETNPNKAPKKKRGKPKTKKRSPHPLMNEPMQPFSSNGSVNMAQSAPLVYVPVLIPTTNASCISPNVVNPFGTMHTHFVNDSSSTTHSIIHTNNFKNSGAHQQLNPILNNNLKPQNQQDSVPTNLTTTSTSTKNNEEMKIPLDEKQQKRLDSRLKEIAVGKSTLGYRNYIKSVPKGKRTDVDPDTPNPYAQSSASEFRGNCQTWRRTLHKYDTP